MDDNAEHGMDTSDLLLLAVAEKGKITLGRTALQKSIYFVSFSLKQDLGYRAHLYGPYSPPVSQTAEYLVQTDFLREEQDVEPGFVQYSYSLTECGRKAAEAARARYASESKTIREVMGICESVAHGDQQVLSWAAKAHFIFRENTAKVWTYEDVAENGRAVGWNITPSQIDQGADLLVALGLVAKTRGK